ncbi:MULTISPECIES: DUF6801 domain-containing protein [Aeromicrobium]|uniref:DUF6801 domain-containing protein n=1 Tax=Aeromicrobium TaxID=2040 RepID=UPI00257BA914|nr:MULTISPECIES: DUF6801 domain-containing protein [Aeromicrobium]
MCEVVAGGLNLGNHDIGVLAETTVPGSVRPGETIAERGVSITLTMPELLRESTVLLLGGRSAEGGSTDAAITLTTGGQTSTVAIPNLSSPRTDIPQQAGSPWLIPASGTVPSITVPAYAAESVALGMPQDFTIAATIHTTSTTLPAALTCAGPSALDLGSIPVSGDPVTNPTTEPTSEPTTEPTSEPTTEPTSEPTSEPTAEPTAEPTTEPTTDPGEEPADDEVELLSSDVLSPGDTITFAFGPDWIGKELAFELHSDPIAMGTRVVSTSGEASVRIPTNAPLGSHTVKVLSRGVVIAEVPVEIVAADAGGDASDDDWASDDYLAAAGGPGLGVAVLGGALVVAGAAVMLQRRRTRRD